MNLDALTPQTQANGFTLWEYRTKDSVFDVMLTGYFDEAAGKLRASDCIYVYTPISKSFATVVLVVKSNDGENVEVSTMGELCLANPD